jgi:hypothetical protein
MKRTTIMGVILALILISMPFTSSVTTSLRNNETYEIELYELNGLRRKKHTAEVSYETLMDIKDELEEFEGTITEEMEYCLELLTEKGVLSEVQWKMKLLNNNQIVTSMDDKSDYIKVESNPDILLFNGHFIGNFQFVVSSPSHVLFAAPILAMIAGPSSIEYGSSYMEYSSLGLLLFIVMGLILIIPIFSSVGYINIRPMTINNKRPNEEYSI